MTRESPDHEAFSKVDSDVQEAFSDVQEEFSEVEEEFSDVDSDPESFVTCNQKQDLRKSLKPKKFKGIPSLEARIDKKLEEIQYFSNPEMNSRKQKMLELDVIREIIFAILGHPSILFSRDGGDIVYTPKNYYLDHLSSAALESIMAKFISIAQRVAHIDRFIQQSRSCDSIWTLAALGDAIEREILGFKNHMIDLEKAFSLKSSNCTEDDPFSVSLLWLLGKVSKLAEPIQLIMDTLLELNILHYNSKESKDCAPSLVVEKTLDFLYYKVAISQELNDDSILQLYLNLFLAVLKPFLVWISEFFACPTLTDPHGEFFLIKQENNVNEIIRPNGCPKSLKQFIPMILSAYQSCSLGHFSDEIAKSLLLDFDSLVQSWWYNVDIENECTNLKSEMVMPRFLLKKHDSTSASLKKDDKKLKLDKPFSTLFHNVLTSLLLPIFSRIDLKVQHFLFIESKVQTHILQFQSFCLFQFNTGLTNIFCDKIIPLDKIEGWIVERVLWESFTENNQECNHFQVELPCIEKEALDEMENPFTRFQLSYNAPWPANLVLTRTVQQRYSRIFTFLATLYYSSKSIHMYRNDATKRYERLYLLSFLNSLTSYCMHSVVIPAFCSINWTECKNLDELISKHESLVLSIETGLFLNQPGVSRSLYEIMRNCRNGIVDEDLGLFISDAMVSANVEHCFFK